MKKSIVFILAGLFAFQFASAADEVTKDMERLPVKAKETVKQHFPKEKVSYVKIDDEILGTTYDVVFASGTEIEFTKDGEWKEIDTKHSAVPATLVPDKIASYVKQNFPDDSIHKLEKNGKHYEVGLSNGLELHFDKRYNFLRADD